MQAGTSFAIQLKMGSNSNNNNNNDNNNNNSNNNNNNNNNNNKSSSSSSSSTKRTRRTSCLGKIVTFHPSVGPWKHLELFLQKLLLLFGLLADGCEEDVYRFTLNDMPYLTKKGHRLKHATVDLGKFQAKYCNNLKAMLDDLHGNLYRFSMNQTSMIED